MRFSRLEISRFRNLSDVTIDLAPGLNTFFGDNGAGKTALLEAVHLLCRGRSFRTQKTQSLIQHGSDQLVVRALIEDELRGPTNLAMSKDRRSKTDLKLNGVSERRLSEVARLTPIQVMLPDIADLVFSGPGGRRSWLDWGTFHVKPDYLEGLRKYIRAVKQRNALMREGADKQSLGPWNEEVASLGELVSDHREAYLNMVIPHFHATLAQLAPEISVEVAYQQGWDSEESLRKLLGDSNPREVKYGSTLWGPHRADVQIRVNRTPAALVLSRGQGKMVASALQIGQAALLSDRDSRSTVFLIDDAGAELDTAHNERFLGLLHQIGGQVLATTTRDPEQSGSGTGATERQLPAARVFHVKRGTIG